MSGVTRLFSQFKRDSSNKYCKIQPYSTTYDNKANLIETHFTVPMNMVLSSGGYQNVGDTPIQGVAKVIAAACKKLKDTYGSNLRIYVIKYRPQSQYKTIATYDQSATNKTHDYSIVDNCATNRNSNSIYDTTATCSEDAQKNKYIYGITDSDPSAAREKLNKALAAIAKDIKENFAGYIPIS